MDAVGGRYDRFGVRAVLLVGHGCSIDIIQNKLLPVGRSKISHDYSILILHDTGSPVWLDYGSGTNGLMLEEALRLILALIRVAVRPRFVLFERFLAG